MRGRHLGVELGASPLPGAGPAITAQAPLVKPRTRHLQQLTHPLDRVRGLLHLDHPVGLYRFCSETKKAAAFFKNARSKRNSAFSRRRRSSSARSSASSTASVSPAAAASRARRTQRPSTCSPTPISAATCAVGRPVSITRRAACSRNSGVYFLRLPDIRTTFPQDQRSHQSGVHHQGSIPVLNVWWSVRAVVVLDQSHTGSADAYS